jgi:hypothetical protein
LRPTNLPTVGIDVGDEPTPQPTRKKKDWAKPTPPPKKKYNKYDDGYEYEWDDSDNEWDAW